MVIIIFIIIGFLLVFFTFDRGDEYSNHFYGAYQELYGNYDHSEYDITQKLSLSHSIPLQCPITESTDLNCVSLRKMGLRMDNGMNGKEKINMIKKLCKEAD
jgi:hypothetical protein